MIVYVVSRRICYEEGAENLAVFETSDSACGFALDQPTLAGSFWTEVEMLQDKHHVMTLHNRGEFIDVERFDMVN
jgi:hypothetical protein